jgi:hypothetical protein
VFLLEPQLPLPLKHPPQSVLLLYLPLLSLDYASAVSQLYDGVVVDVFLEDEFSGLLDWLVVFEGGVDPRLAHLQLHYFGEPRLPGVRVAEAGC